MQKQKGETADYFFSDDYFQQELTTNDRSIQSMSQIGEAFLGFIVVYTHCEGFHGAHHYN